MLHVTLNGEARTLPEPLTVEELRVAASPAGTSPRVTATGAVNPFTGSMATENYVWGFVGPAAGSSEGRQEDRPQPLLPPNIGVSQRSSGTNRPSMNHTA